MLPRTALEAHGQRVAAVLADSLSGKEQTKFIITAGDEHVCPICLSAEQDGVIPFDQPYSNGRMAPPFHGKTCRCRQVTSGDLVGAVEVNAQPEENAVVVGIHNPPIAQAAAIREYGSGNGPPDHSVSAGMDNIPDEVFVPLFNDLHEFYRKRFLGE